MFISQKFLGSPFQDNPPLILLELMIHLSQELVFFKVPSYSERRISSCEKHNGRNDTRGSKKRETGLDNSM
jgi:hypothetical protein